MREGDHDVYPMIFTPPPSLASALHLVKQKKVKERFDWSEQIKLSERHCLNQGVLGTSWTREKIVLLIFKIKID